ncbi:MAG: hypothetical protein K0S33_3953 [Bacteroidetes bacterium]|jgi:hypothetical protein|nr:hypothetical protein [Bacteroidota bacterium]
MNKLLAFLILQYLCFAVHAQHTVFSSGSKYGVKKGGEIIIKAKYSSILPGDTDIFAVEKKGKWQYIKPDGRVIYEEKDAKFFPFEKGYGLVSNTEGSVWRTIDTAGTLAGTFFDLQAPEICADKLLFSRSKKVYSRDGTFLFSFDTLSALSADLFLLESTVLKGGSKKILGFSIGKTKAETEKRVLIKSSGKLIEDLHSLTMIGNDTYYIMKGWPIQESIIDAKGQELFSGLTGYSMLKSGLWLVKAGNAFGIIDPAAKKWLVDTTGIASLDSINGVYWLGAKDRSFSYVVSGTQVTKVNACFKQKLGEDKLMAESPGQIHLYTASGRLISGGYSGFYNNAKDGLIVALKGRKYVFLDMETGKEVGPYRDLYYATGSRSTATKGQQLMKAALFVITLPVFPLVQNSMKGNDRYESYIYTANYPSMYNGDLAIIGLADKEDISYRKDSLFLTTESALKYYYINKKGEIVSPGYEEAMDFANGWAWVKDSKGYFRVDKTFRPLDKEHYLEVDKLWEGEYYTVSKGPFNKGLIDKNGKLVAPTKYDWIETENDKIIGRKGGDGTVLVTK